MEHKNIRIPNLMGEKILCKQRIKKNILKPDSPPCFMVLNLEPNNLINIDKKKLNKIVSA